MANPGSDRFAVLIDADNASSAHIEGILREVERHGVATIRRAYGDWTTPSLRGWKDALHAHAIQPVQQFAFTTGKNATDSSLIIDAMDLLHTAPLDGFCLVSSDSDFTRLATRIRESDRKVIGFGEQKTPPAFVKACNRFVFVEILRGLDAAEMPVIESSAPLEPMLRAAIEGSAREDGWSPLSLTGSMLVKASPSFDSRNYGFEKLGELVRAQAFVEVRKVPTASGASTSHLFVRLKQPRTDVSRPRSIPATA